MMKRFATRIGRPLALTLIAGIAACGDAGVTYELDGRAMGTTYSIRIVAAVDELDRERLREQIAGAIDRIEQRFSTYLPDSDISRFNTSASTDWLPVTREVCELVERALDLAQITEGAFDITVAPLVDAWGFGPDFDVRSVPDASRIDALLADVGYGLVDCDCARPALRKRRPAVAIDLSGFAKGYAVDAAAEIIDAANVRDYLVEIGGELRARGVNGQGLPWRIAIENPLDPAAAPAGVLRLRDEAMATSGDYRNVVEIGGKRYSHTIDPASGRPIDHALTSVTVLGRLAADADAWATALLVLGPDAGLAVAERHGIAARLLVRNRAGLEVLTSTEFDRRAAVE